MANVQTQPATITIAGLEVPPDKKKAKLTDAEGLTFYIWKDKVANYQVGSVYDVQFSTSEFNGHTIRNIESAKRSSAAPTVVTPKAAAAVAAATSGIPHDEHIYVSMREKEAIRAGLLDPFNGEETVRLGKISRHAHSLIWGWKPPAQRPATPAPTPAAPVPHDDMNDSIPF